MYYSSNNCFGVTFLKCLYFYAALDRRKDLAA
jgi:hypothetical protein